jgi:hypothetical protein
VFIFVTSFAYSWRSSCSIAVNCGGGELLCEVDRDRLEAMVFRRLVEFKIDGRLMR